jgi:hypothetical protein
MQNFDSLIKDLNSRIEAKEKALATKCQGSERVARRNEQI